MCEFMTPVLATVCGRGIEISQKFNIDTIDNSVAFPLLCVKLIVKRDII